VGLAELDVDGEIDDHAAMCLQHAIDGARAGAAAMILADLRELEAIDAGGVELFLRHHADCHCGGVTPDPLACRRAGD
jgi:anti-anti-sigma regulatory factor